MAEAPTRYVVSADGVRLAWTEVGSGPTLVIAANHITDFKRDSPETLRYDAVQRLSQTFRVVRYDHRGTGSSQRNVERQGQEAWVEDLEAVVGAASAGQPVVLLAQSQASPYGSVFAAKRPDTVSHLVMFGPYPFGGRAAGLLEAYAARSDAFLEFVRLDWDAQDPAARALAASRIIPEPRPQELAFQALLPLMANKADAMRFFEADARQDAREALGRIRAPTLVMATADDAVVLPEWSRSVAAAIPGAIYVELPGYNHVPLKHDPSWEPYFEHLLAFVAAPEPPIDRLADLSSRERDILAGVCAGLSNEAIALQRRISVKTVRNHLTRIFDKLRVRSRTQAALLASRAGIGAERSEPPRGERPLGVAFDHRRLAENRTPGRLLHRRLGLTVMRKTMPITAAKAGNPQANQRRHSR